MSRRTREAEATTSDAEWFERTGHCGRCGNPGNYCTCTDRDPCGCKHLHEVGTARRPDAINAFATPDETQEELW